MNTIRRGLTYARRNPSVLPMTCYTGDSSISSRKPREGIDNGRRLIFYPKFCQTAKRGCKIWDTSLIRSDSRRIWPSAPSLTLGAYFSIEKSGLILLPVREEHKYHKPQNAQKPQQTPDAFVAFSFRVIPQTPDEKQETTVNKYCRKPEDDPDMDIIADIKTYYLGDDAHPYADVCSQSILSYHDFPLSCLR